MDAAFAALLGEYTGHADLRVLSVTALLLAARLAPLLMLSPWVFPLRAGAVVSASVIALLWLVLLPVAVRAASTPPLGAAVLVALWRELLIGAAFAFVARLPLEAMTAAGGLAERAGGDMLPWSSPSHAPLSALYRWLGVALFVVAAGPEVALVAVADGLSSLPLGQPLPWAELSTLTWTLVGWCAAAVAFGLVLSMPVALGVLLVNLAEALAQRWLQEWPTSAVWMPLRRVAALGFVALSLSFVSSALPGAFTDSIGYARLLLSGLTP